MTTCIIHGDPGARKTATLVGQYGVPALYAGRTVITNIRGFNSLEAVEKAYKKPLPENAKLISVPFTRDGFREMGKFFHWAEKGALILMDEGQRIYPTRLRSLDYFDCNPAREAGFIDEQTGKVEDISTVEEAFDCHRHMGWDIYISTTNIAKIHKEIRQVAEFGYRQKDLTGVSPVLAFILGDIKRVKHNAENSGTADSGALESTTHRINKKVFAVYQSTAIGKAKGTLAKTTVFAQPKLLFLAAIVLFGAFNLGTTIHKYGTIFPTAKDFADYDRRQAESASGSRTSPDAQSDQMGGRGHTPEARRLSSGDVPNGEFNRAVALIFLDSLYSYDGSVTNGHKTSYFFTVKDGDDFIPLTVTDFPDADFRILLKDAYVLISYAGNVKTLFNRPYKPKVEEPQRAAPENALAAALP